MICTTPMCSDARASVQQMRSTFNQLTAVAQFSRTRFESTVLSIENSFNANYSWYDDLIPFNPVCCTLSQIGSQADALTADMLRSVGAAAPPAPAPASDPLSSLTTLAGLAIVGYLLFQIAPSFRRAG